MEDGWQKKEYQKEDLIRAEAQGSNFGLRLTESLCDVDLDCPEAVRLADFFLPKTKMEHGRPSAPRAHRWYRLTGKTKYKKFDQTGAQGKTLLEMRLSSKKSVLQTMIPPSVHPNGEQLEWSDPDDLTPTQISYNELRDKCGELAAACLLVRTFPPNNRNNLALALSGALLRHGWSVDKTEGFIRLVFSEGGSDAPEARVRAVQATQARLEINEPVTGIPTLTEILGEDVVRKLVDWLGLVREEAHSHIASEIDFVKYVASAHSDMIWRPEKEAWFVWDGRRWAEDKSEGMEIWNRVNRSRDVLEEEALKFYGSIPQDARDSAEKNSTPSKDENEGDPETEEEPASSQQVKQAKKVRQTLGFLSTMRKVRTLEAICRSMRQHLQRPDVVFDQDPWLFNVQNGTLDLRAIELRPHAKEDYLTKLAPVTFDGGAKCPRWEEFINRFLPHAPTAEFVHRYLGYAMTGQMTEQVFPIFWGRGNNGKSTLVGLIAKVFGDYAKTAGSRAFIDTGAETQPFLVALEGSRFVRCSEPATGRLNESLIKQITGDDEIVARGLHEAARAIRPTWKGVMVCNDAPEVRGGDDGIWRRLRFVPFEVSLAESEVIRGFDALLAEELPGILNWCVRGCVDWQVNGLPTPPEILETTETYKQESDSLDEFIEDSLDLHLGIEDVREKSALVYKAYRTWCQNNRVHDVLSHAAFSTRLKFKGFRKLKTNGQMTWVGLRLNKNAKAQASSFGGFFEDEGT